MRAIRRDELKPGDVFTSSHGYDLLVTEVQDNAEVRTDDRHVGILGHLHADPERTIRSERYPAGSTVNVYTFREIADREIERANKMAQAALGMIGRVGGEMIATQLDMAAHPITMLARLATYLDLYGRASYTALGRVA